MKNRWLTLTMRASAAEYRSLPLRAHELLRDVPLYDVSSVDLPGGGSGRTVADIRALESATAPVRGGLTTEGRRQPRPAGLQEDRCPDRDGNDDLRDLKEIHRSVQCMPGSPRDVRPERSLVTVEAIALEDGAYQRSGPTLPLVGGRRVDALEVGLAHDDHEPTVAGRAEDALGLEEEATALREPRPQEEVVDRGLASGRDEQSRVLDESEPARQRAHDCDTPGIAPCPRARRP